MQRALMPRLVDQVVSQQPRLVLERYILLPTAVALVLEEVEPHRLAVVVVGQGRLEIQGWHRVPT